MKKPLVTFALVTVAACLPGTVRAEDGANQGVENGSDIGAFFGAGPEIDRDAMDEAAERENRKAYLDQDPKMPAHISPPVGSTAVQPAAAGSSQSDNRAQAQQTAAATGSKADKQQSNSQKPQHSKIGRFFRTVGDVLTPNWLIDFGLGPNNDTDKGPDNLNKNY